MTNMNSEEKSHSNFEVKIGDHRFQFESVSFDEDAITGGQLADAVGKHPISNFVILQHLKSGELETLRPNERVHIDNDGIERFFVIEGDALFRFTVDGRSMVWPKPKISGEHIKFLARAKADDELIIDTEEGDELIENDQLVKIRESGVEEFKIRKTPKLVTVQYKHEPHELEKRKYTTEELLEEFDVPNGYKLDLITEEGDFIELVPGEKIKIIAGLEFTSHAPRGQSS